MKTKEKETRDWHDCAAAMRKAQLFFSRDNSDMKAFPREGGEKGEDGGTDGRTRSFLPGLVEGTAKADTTIVRS